MNRLIALFIVLLALVAGANDRLDRRPPADALLVVSANRADASSRDFSGRVPTVGAGATFSGRAIEFAGGSTSVVTYPSDTRLHGVPFTVCFWARIDNSSTRVNLVGRSTVGSSPEQYRGWYVHFIGTGAGSYGPTFTTNKNGSNYKSGTVGSPTTYADGTWRHWAWTCADANSYGSWKVYLNGVDTAFSQISAGTVSDISNSELLTLGGQTSANQTSYLDGALDNVLYFNRALTAAEVGAIYSEGRP